MVKVSIVVPTYSCVNYLQRTMDSLGSQTFQDFEIILIEDDSWDGTKKLVEVYSKIPNVKVIWHEKNQGLGNTLNDGLVAATGDYIAIQHADDVSLPTRIEKQVAYLDSHPNVALVGTWCQNIDIGDKPMRDGWWLRQFKRIPDDPKVIHDKLLEMNCLIHTSVMFRKEMLTKTGWYDQGAVPSEDYDLWLRVSEHFDIGIIPQVLVQYRHHPTQISRTDGGNLMKEKARIAVERAKKRRGIK